MISLLSFRPFRKIPTTDRDLNLLQSHIADSFASMKDTPRFMQAVQLNAGPNYISHGLGRNWVSWWAGNYDTSAATIKPLLGAVAGVVPDRTKFLVINASSPVTLDIFVF